MSTCDHCTYRLVTIRVEIFPGVYKLLCTPCYEQWKLEQKFAKTGGKKKSTRKKRRKR